MHQKGDQLYLETSELGVPGVITCLTANALISRNGVPAQLPANGAPGMVSPTSGGGFLAATFDKSEHNAQQSTYKTKTTAEDL